MPKIDAQGIDADDRRVMDIWGSLHYVHIDTDHFPQTQQLHNQTPQQHRNSDSQVIPIAKHHGSNEASQIYQSAVPRPQSSSFTCSAKPNKKQC